MNTSIENTNQSSGISAAYKPFLKDILMQIQNARYEMLMSVSQKTLLLYWNIGSAVSEKMKSAGWGEAIIEKLAKDLQTEVPGVRGFSARNIWRMKMFAEFYATIGISATTVTKLQPENSATAVAELQKQVYELVINIGWVQNCIILEKCKDIKQIAFYLKQTKEKGWSKLDLLEKIEQNYFENHFLAQNNFEKTISQTLKSQVA
ncbi:MAG: DUF1016 N-terminal domain-containing protein, partial [Bacteroidales bacterium]|nr:DUF1016 N-terminal domain-containing protein [Bacteroidales bacterium]